MALRAGYIGIRKSMAGLIKSLATAKIIKSIGEGLNLTTAGKLNLTSATASKLGGIKVGDGLEIDNGVLSTKGGSIVLSPVEGISVSANTPVSVAKGDIYLFFVDNGATISGAAVIAGSLSQYILVTTVGIAYAIVKMTGTSFSSSKAGALIKLAGANDNYGYAFADTVLNSTSFDMPDGSVCACVTNAADITTEDATILSKVTAAFSFNYGLVKMTDDSQTFDQSVSLIRLNAVIDHFI